MKVGNRLKEMRDLLADMGRDVQTLEELNGARNAERSAAVLDNIEYVLLAEFFDHLRTLGVFYESQLKKKGGRK